MQKFSPPLQRIRKDADADDEPPPLQPANISALAKRRIDRALRIVKRECAFDY
jgi:hypothetical protein